MTKIPLYASTMLLGVTCLLTTYVDAAMVPCPDQSAIASAGWNCSSGQSKCTFSGLKVSPTLLPYAWKNDWSTVGFFDSKTVWDSVPSASSFSLFDLGTRDVSETDRGWILMCVYKSTEDPTGDGGQLNMLAKECPGNGSWGVSFDGLGFDCY